MAAPTIVSGAWTTIPLGGSATAVFYADRPIDAIEVSINGGTWFGAADGPKALPTVGGTLTVDTVEEIPGAPGLMNRATVTIDDVQAAGSDLYRVRGVNSSGAGPAFDAAVSAFASHQAMAGLLMMLPHHGLLEAVDIAPRATGSGFAVLYVNHNPTTATPDWTEETGGTIDFGNGVVLSGVTEYRRGMTVLVEYSQVGLAQGCVAFLSPAERNFHLASTLATRGGSYLVGVDFTYSSGPGAPTGPVTGAWKFRRHTDTAWTDYTASASWEAGSTAVSRVDGSTLAPAWTHLGTGAVSVGNAVQHDDTVLVPGLGFARRASNGDTISKSTTSTTVSVVDELDWATGDYLSVSYAVRGSTLKHLNMSSARRDQLWYGLAEGNGTTDIPDAIRRRYALGGSVYEIDRMEAEFDGSRWLMFFDGLDPLAWQQVDGIHPPRAGQIVDTQPSFALPGTYAPERWGELEDLGLEAGTSAIVYTTAAGALSAILPLEDDSYLSPSKSVQFNGLVAYALTGGVKLGGGLPPRTEPNHVVIVGDGVVMSDSTVTRTVPETAVTHIAGLAPAPAGAWALIELNRSLGGSTDPVLLTPPGVELPVPSESEMWAVASINEAGEWGTDSFEHGMPEDPVSPLPPTTPEGEWPELALEGDVLSAALGSFDPNAGIVDHPDPITSITIRFYDSLTNTWRTSGTAAAAGGAISVANDGAGSLTVEFAPHGSWSGTVRFAAQAVATTENGLTLYSGIWEHSMAWLGEADAPQIVEAEFPDGIEDHPVVGVFVGADDDFVGPYTWRLSPQVDEPYTTTSTTAVVIYDMDGITPAGLVTIVSGQGTLNPDVRFLPATNWHGTAEGSVRLEDPALTSEWVRFTVTIEPQVDPLGAITPATFGVFAEDGYVDVVFTVADPDYPDTSMRREWSVSMDGTYWRDDDGVSEELHVVLDPEGTHDSDELTVSVRIIGQGNFHGPAAFWLKCTKTAGDEVRTSVRRITGMVTAVPDAPRAPQPSRMPTVEQGQLASQVFTTVDPDGGDTFWTFQVRRVGGTWSATTANLGTTVGTVTVDNDDTSDKRAEVSFTAAPLFRGRYAFDIRVVDSGGLASPATRVTGVVAARGVYAELVQLVRSSTSASLVPLGPVHPIDPRLTWTVKGPDGATMSVDAATLRRIASWHGMEVDELVAPWSVELHVWGDGQLQFAGPLTRPAVTADDVTATLEARGITEYLTRRELENGEATFTGIEQTEIIASIINAQQDMSYGDLLIDTSTVTDTSESRTVTFEEGTSIADVIEELQDQLDGPEVRITPDRELLADLILCTDRRGVLIFNEHNTTGLKLEEDADSITTVAHVDGDEVSGSASAGTAALAKYGRVTSRMKAKRVGTTGGADAAAARLIALRGFAGRTVRFTHIAKHDAPAGRGAWDYAAGDTCTLEVETLALGRIELDGRIVNKTLRCAPGSLEDFLIDLDVEILAPDGVIRPPRSAHNPDYLEQVTDLHRALR